MTEQDLSTPVPEEFNLEAWIDGAAVSQRSVDIHARPDLYAEYQDWERRYTAAEKRASADEGALGEESLLDELADEGQRIYDAWMASKATWYLRALDPDELDAITKDTPRFPDLPVFAEPEPKAPTKGGDAALAAFQQAHSAWQGRRAAFLDAQRDEREDLARKRKAAADDANLRMISEALVRIESASGSVTSAVTVDQLRRIGKRIGERQITHLLQAASLASMQDPEISLPFSSSSSRAIRE